MNVFIKNLLNNKKILISLLLIFSVFKTYAGLFDNYSKKTPDEIIQSLAIEQIDNPEDPYINYNLGVALYQTQKYEAAKNSFDRAIHNAKNPKLKERCFFNLANSCYKNVLSKLPAGWEAPEAKIDPKELEALINDMQSAIKNYENILEKDKDNKQAKTNANKAKALLEKLLKKQPNQKQDQNKDNKDNKQDEKDKNEKQDQQNSQDSKNQESQDSQSKENQDSKQNQSQQQQSQDHQQNNPKDKQEDKQQDQKQKASQENQAQQAKSDDQEQKQETEQQLQQAQAQNASGQKAKQESAEEKSMRIMLENLQSEEDDLQKAIIQRQTKGQKPLESGQKPW